MLILVFDTSTRNGTVGWVKMDDSADIPEVLDFADTYMPAIPGHAERLLERIDSVLGSGGYSSDDVDLIVLGKGPGTFTGLRIGFSTAKSLSLVHRIPLVTISTLQMLACNARTTGPVLSLIDARRKEVYAGLFDVKDGNGIPSALPLGSEMVAKPEAVVGFVRSRELNQPVQLVGDGAIAYKSVFAELGVPALPGSVALDACLMGIQGYRRFQIEGPVNTAMIEPSYLREPDARKPRAPFGMN
jgi:tRNA threonylcarbamoyladenosine biosynthesis protein TsaB